jgi:hypothetical protein
VHREGEGGTALEMAPLLLRKSAFHIIRQGVFWLSDTPQVPGSTGAGAASFRAQQRGPGFSISRQVGSSPLSTPILTVSQPPLMGQPCFCRNGLARCKKKPRSS